MDANEFRSAAHKVVEDVIDYFKTLPTRRVLPSISPGYLRPQLPESAPETPEPFDAIISDVDKIIKPGLTHWQHPNFMAFFPATTTYPSMLGELYSAAFNAPAFNWLCSPACTELETVVLDWVAKMLGLPKCFLSDGPTGGGGVIQGSASESVIPVMVAAREMHVKAVLEKEGLLEEQGESGERRLKREDRSAEVKGKLVALASEHCHSLGVKAANILGLRHRSVRAGPESGFSMTGKALREKIAECDAQGLRPFFVIATLGTTATCAVDDFAEIVKIKKERPEIWIHVDAAYAGAALCCEEMRDIAGVKYLGEFDSFDLNMHKWMLVNFDASCLFLKNRLPVTSAMSITPSFLVNPEAISGLVTDYRDWQIPLGRRFRALKIWFVLRTYGITGIQQMIRKHIALAKYFASLVRQRPDRFEIVSGPSFALTVLRCVPPQDNPGSLQEGISNGSHRAEDEMNNFEAKRNTALSDAANALTKQVYDLVNGRGELFLTSAMINGIFVIRVVSANESADEKHLRGAFDTILAASEEVLAAKQVNGHPA